MEITKINSDKKVNTEVNTVADLIINNFYSAGLIIKKYNVSENVMQEACKEVVRRSISDLDPSPIIYLGLGENEYQLSKANEREFYRDIVGKFIAGLIKNEYFNNTESFKNVKTKYEKSFEDLYVEYYTGGNRLTNKNNLGSNLTRLIEMINPSMPKSIKILTNNSLLSILPKGSVNTVEGKGLLTKESKELVDRVNFAHGILSGLLIGGQALKQAIAVPGWSIDILKHSWNNPQWDRTVFAQGSILEEIAYKEIIEL